jgi:hypothetical protein
MTIPTTFSLNFRNRNNSLLSKTSLWYSPPVLLSADSFHFITGPNDSAYIPDTHCKNRLVKITNLNWLSHMALLKQFLLVNISKHLYWSKENASSWGNQFSLVILQCIIGPLIVAVVPKLLWICTRVKVEVINNKTTWVRAKSTGSKTYLSKKYKVSLKKTWSTK